MFDVLREVDFDRCWCSIKMNLWVRKVFAFFTQKKRQILYILNLIISLYPTNALKLKRHVIQSCNKVRNYQSMGLIESLKLTQKTESFPFSHFSKDFRNVKINSSQLSHVHDLEY